MKPEQKELWMAYAVLLSSLIIGLLLVWLFSLLWQGK